VAKKSDTVKFKKKQKYRTRQIHRCKLCGRSRAYMRKFDLCRLCFRELAHKGELPGVVKASW
jgi:small subunit ribosomal protein S14